MAGYLRLEVDRYVQTHHELAFRGFDLTGTGLLMQVRLYRDAPGAPLRELTIGGGLTLLSVTWAGTVPTSTLRVSFAANIFPFAADRSADLVLAHDLLAAPPGRDAEPWLAGDLIVLGGVTQHG